MDRRHFLKTSAKVLTAFPLINTVAGSIPNVLARSVDVSNEGLDLIIITAYPNEALELAQGLIQKHFSKHSRVQFTEFEMAGEHISEIALLRNKRLINYKYQNDALSLELRRMAQKLDIPAKVKNPICLKFTKGYKLHQARQAQIFRQNILIEEVDLYQPDKMIELNGVKGPMTINVKNGKIHVVDTSCQHKTCLQTGNINRTGQSVVCIPNQISIALS